MLKTLVLALVMITCCAAVPDTSFPHVDLDFLAGTNDVGELYVPGLTDPPTPPRPNYEDARDNCLGPPPTPRVIGGCNDSTRTICVCNVGCYWIQVCEN